MKYKIVGSTPEEDERPVELKLVYVGSSPYLMAKHSDRGGGNDDGWYRILWFTPDGRIVRTGNICGSGLHSEGIAQKVAIV